MKFINHASEISVILVICILLCGCIGTTNSIFSKNSTNTNPESGIVNWIEAMNAHDAGRLYQLSPNMIKKQINREDFLKANADNAMFLDNITFVDYTILNTTSKGNFALIKAHLVMAKPDPDTGNVTYSPIFYTFNEYFEENEWKIWATGLEP